MNTVVMAEARSQTQSQKSNIHPPVEDMNQPGNYTISHLLSIRIVEYTKQK